jgi:TolB protein
LLWQESGAHTFLPPPRIREGDTGIGEGANKDIHPDTKERTMGAARFGRNNLLKATLLVATGVLAACLVALIGAAGPVKAAFPGENGKIAFTSERDGNAEIYAMEADGTGPVNLTNNPAVDAFPAVSADGTKIAFESDRDGNTEIYTMNADGSGPVVRLTNNPDWDYEPEFSPDGTKIAFSSYRNAANFESNFEIYTMNADGTEQTNLTNDSFFDYTPTFSPDGTKIAFSSYRNGNQDIFVMNADGTGQTNLTNHRAVDAEPTFSADGTKIAFVSTRDGNAEIYTMNADGSGQTNLTNTPANEQSPTFSPDGTKIAFSSDRDGNWETYAMNADGSGQTNLTNNPPVDDYAPDWGPLATRYDFAGFYSPVDNLPTFNKAKAGSAIPVKFSLDGDQGLDVFARNATGNAASPTSGPVACDSTAEIDPIETTVSASSSGLSYDAASDTYTYVWKTHKGWTGCRQLVVEFDDGTVERANFRFVK